MGGGERGVEINLHSLISKLLRLVEAEGDAARDAENVRAPHNEGEESDGRGPRGNQGQAWGEHRPLRIPLTFPQRLG